MKKINKRNINSDDITPYSCRLGFKDFNIGNAVSLIKEIIKTVRDENKEETEEYLNIKVTTTHVKIKSNANCNDKANSTPK